MPYSEYNLDQVRRRLGVTTAPADLFPDVVPKPVPGTLAEILADRTQLALISEKSRSECIVAPILWTVRKLSPKPLAIFSGQRLDVDSSLGLWGECDFLLALTQAILPLRRPIVAIVEAKKGDIEAGLGQCVAQMIAADRFNQEESGRSEPIHGCVTTGEDWQFIRLADQQAWIDERRYYLNDLPSILGVWQAIIARSGGAEAA